VEQIQDQDVPTDPSAAVGVLFREAVEQHNAGFREKANEAALLAIAAGLAALVEAEKPCK
jgi:hypothetical protein